MADMAHLLEIMARLRDRERGCPWDVEQTFATIAPYTIEEAYEVAEAIRLADDTALKDELGDLLFQVVFHAQMAREAGLFSFADVVEAVCDKMVRRHPHVFGDASIDDAAAQTLAWEAHKAAEREAEGASALDGVALALPALARAAKLQARAAGVGFDWAEMSPVIAKIEEELGELREALARGAAQAELTDELGDLLFTVVNLARHLKLDPEAALRDGNAKFTRRFKKIEAWLGEDGRTAAQSDLDEMDRLWKRAKAE